MSLDLKTYQNLKSKADSLKRDADRASGAFDEALAQLKKDFGVSTIDEAKALLEELQTKDTKAEQKFKAALEAFEKEWGDVLR